MTTWNTKSGRDNYYMDDYLIKLYHYNSRHTKELLSKNVPNENAKIRKKEIAYRESIDLGDTSDLRYEISTSISDALKKRRTSWEFKGDLNKEDLFKLLINSFGGIDEFKGDKPFRKRTYPSGGGLYPIRPYILINKVKGMKGNCLYLFDGNDNKLKLIRDDIDSSEMYKYTSLTYSGIASYDNASIYVFFATDLTETMPKYGLLSYRLSLLETGHMAENLMLCAAALGKASVPYGGLFEKELNKYLGLKEDTVLYFYAVG